MSTLLNTSEVSQQSITKDLILLGFHFSQKVPHYYFYSNSVIQWLSKQVTYIKKKRKKNLKRKNKKPTNSR